MNIPEQFIRPFPEPKDVFSNQLEEHSKHFLPICSLDMRFLEPNSEELWIHFVQPVAICEGRVGEYTTQYHDKYNFADSMCFDVDENGKYTFNGDWRFFEINHDELPNLEQVAKNFSEISQRPYDESLEIFEEIMEDIQFAYEINPLIYKIIKDYYQQYHVIPNDTWDLEDMAIEALADTEKCVQYLKAKSDTSSYPDDKAEIIDEISDFEADTKEWITEEGFDNLDDYLNASDSMGNLQRLPRDKNGKTFKYIGWLSGYNFQAYGCDELHLFFDRNEKKAVIRLVYS